MPRRTDIEKIMIIGSGPIIIGQACEFDYSGTQAVKALKQEGFEVILVNSNPATIMTDTGLADRIYIEPITLPYVRKIIELERPDALLPTVGGQTALNMALRLYEQGILDDHQVEMIGANAKAIKKAEDRDEFKKAMKKINIQTPRSKVVKDLEEATSFLEEIGFPVILRPSFTLGGSGGGVCHDHKKFNRMIKQALFESPLHEVLLEESVIGWQEFELEVMRDCLDNVIIICSIENIDPMGIHTGDSITVAPQQTLTDKEYQNLRDMSIRIIKEIGVETGGSNIQFAVNPRNGDVMVIEMNPRVSRSSALASKATGFAIARIAAKLSVGYSLDEIPNDITRKTPASFEPTIDYIVTKIPRFSFEKFPYSSRVLDTQMRSVGETMAIGRNFPESFQKAVRSLELGHMGWGMDLQHIEIASNIQARRNQGEEALDFWLKTLKTPNDQRFFYLREALNMGIDINKLHAWTQIDPWFLYQLNRLLNFEKSFVQAVDSKPIPQKLLRMGKSLGYSNEQIACLSIHKEYRQSILKLSKAKKGSYKFFSLMNNIHQKVKEAEKRIQNLCEQYEINPVFKRVDTCAAEFESSTPYLYSTYGQECEAHPSSAKKGLVLGGGPNRIGQGIEFDYCCCHASSTLKEFGIESIMVNSNPETVSTDYDTSDRLYFEPLTLENIMHIYKKENSCGELLGIILQFGGQTPLSLANDLKKQGAKILGTSPEQINRAEDREEFNKMIYKLGLKHPKGALAVTFEEGIARASEIGYPVLVRPSYVLGGQSMVIIHDEDQLKEYMLNIAKVSMVRPILIDEFLQDSVEIDVDALSDQEDVFVAGIMEHIEQAGVHSGDSACILPPKSISQKIIEQVKKATTSIALELKILGLINIQFVIRKNEQQDEIFVLEVNPRASRTVPFVSKSIGVPLAKWATRILLGEKLKDINKNMNTLRPKLYSVKEVVLPFKKFSGTDTILGPEMKSTGEVMGLGRTPSEAFCKAQEAIGLPLPQKGNIFISINNHSKPYLVATVKKLIQAGYKIIATSGTADYFKKSGIPVEIVKKVHEGSPNILDKIENNEINFILNVPTSHLTRNDALEIRLAAIRYSIPYFTTLSAVLEAFTGMVTMRDHEISVYPIS